MPACATSLASPGGTSAHASSYSTLERSTVHGRQSTVRDPGSTVHGPRSTLHGPRSTVPSTRGECVAAPANTQPFVPAADGSRLSHCRRVAVSPCRRKTRATPPPGGHRAITATNHPFLTRAATVNPGAVAPPIALNFPRRQPPNLQHRVALLVLPARSTRLNGALILRCPVGRLVGRRAVHVCAGARAAMQVQRSISCANHCWLNQLAISDRACQ